METLAAQYRTVALLGGTGSFGQAMTRHLLATHPAVHIRVLSRSELPQVEMQEELPDPRVTYMLGDIRDLDRLRLALRGVDLVVHAAALKHVPLGERNPEEMVSVNVMGTRNVIRACIECDVQRAVLLSTDKAVHPSTLYGSTKLCAERLWLQANVYTPQGTQFVATRYGNVFGSRGSVLTRYRACYRAGQALPLTHWEATRFFMDMPAATALVLFAVAYAPRGGLVVPVLPACRIQDVCRAVTNAVVLEGPQAEWDVTLIGLRAGEKLHEVLATDDELCHAWYVPGSVRTAVYLLPPRVGGWTAAAIAHDPQFTQWCCPDPSDASLNGYRTSGYRSDTWPWRLSVAELRARLAQIP